MESDTLTLKLQGEVSLDDFAKAITRFNALVHGLTKAVAPDSRIEWTVSDLQSGSATATTLGTADSVEPLRKVRRAYQSVGEALSEYVPLAYAPPVRKAAEGIRDILNGRVTEAIFETSETEVIVRAAPTSATPVARRIVTTRGAIAGRIQTLSSRGGLRFTLYDLLEDRAISCYLAEGSEDLLRDAWGRLTVVEGLIRRDPISGRPISIRHVGAIHPRPDPDPGAYRLARGAVPLPPDGMLPEDRIRRMRDA